VFFDMSMAFDCLWCFKQEFSIEIPDAEADAIKTVHEGTFLRIGNFWRLKLSLVVEYVARSPQGKFFELALVIRG
jgi:hypothetical protein